MVFAEIQVGMVLEAVRLVKAADSTLGEHAAGKVVHGKCLLFSKVDEPDVGVDLFDDSERFGVF